MSLTQPFLREGLNLSTLKIGTTLAIWSVQHEKSSILRRLAERTRKVLVEAEQEAQITSVK